MVPTDNLNLEQKTQAYWDIQRVSRGYGGKPKTTQEVMRICQKSLSELNPGRPLAQKFSRLLVDVVVGGKRKKGQVKAQVIALNRASTK